MSDSNLTVAVTGPTGTFGFGLMPLLQADERIARIVGIARRPFDANEHGWTKMTYRQGDVRDRAALEEAFQGAEVVVHTSFHDHRGRVARDDPQDQRRGHAQHIPGGGRGGRPAIRIRLVDRRLWVPSR